MTSRPLPVRRVVSLAALALLLGGCTLPGGHRTPGAVVPTPSAPVTSALPDAPATPTDALPGDGAPSSPAPGLPSADRTPSSAIPPPATPGSPTPWVPSWTPTLPAATSPATGLPATSPAPGLPGASGTVLTIVPGELRHLARENASQAMLWVEGPAQPAGGSGWIYALGTTVACQATSAPLEFRFAQTTGTLSLSVAQAAESRSSAERLDWSVLVDGRPAVSRSLGFAETADLTVPLAGVSSVQVLLTHPGPCQGLATGLVTRAFVTG